MAEVVRGPRCSVVITEDWNLWQGMTVWFPKVAKLSWPTVSKVIKVDLQLYKGMKRSRTESLDDWFSREPEGFNPTKWWISVFGFLNGHMHNCQSYSDIDMFQHATMCYCKILFTVQKSGYPPWNSIDPEKWWLEGNCSFEHVKKNRLLLLMEKSCTSWYGKTSPDLHGFKF